MSKGKRRSLPGSVAVVQEKMRNGCLTPQDREVLMQVSRVDLIALIEQEMGVVLKSSQKNSVRAMVDWLIGPDEAAEQQARYRRSSSATKRLPPAQAHTSPHGQQQPGAEVQDFDAASFDGFADISDHQVAREPSAASGAGSKQASFQTGGAEADNQPAEQGAEAFWMYELHMQLNAAAAGYSAMDAADDMATAESPAAASQQALMSNIQQQLSARPGMSADEQLADHLLQQLLQDMQLGPALTQQQQQLQPEVNSLEYPNPLLLPGPRVMDHHHHQQQQQQLLLQSMMPQQLLQPSPAPAPQMHIQLDQQQLHLNPCDEPQQPQIFQQHLQQQHHLQDRSSYLTGTLAESCPLPVATHADCGAAPGLMAYSSEALHTWQATDHAAAAAAATASYTLGKRNKQQLFDGDAPDETEEEALLSVEQSGPSGDLAVKRMSFVLPGSGSVAALPTSTVAGSRSLISSQRQLPSLAFDAYMDQRQLKSNQGTVKTLARRFKTLLRGRAAKLKQQQAAMASCGPAAPAAAEPYTDLWATLANEATGDVPCEGHLNSMPTIVGAATPEHSMNLAAPRLPSAPVTDFQSQLQRLRALYANPQEGTEQAAAAAAAAAAAGPSRRSPSMQGMAAPSFESQLQQLRAMYGGNVDTESPSEMVVSPPDTNQQLPLPDEVQAARFEDQLQRLRMLYGGNVLAGQPGQQVPVPEAAGAEAAVAAEAIEQGSLQRLGQQGASSCVAYPGQLVEMTDTAAAAAAPAVAAAAVLGPAAAAPPPPSLATSEQRPPYRVNKTLANKLSKVFRMGSSNRTSSPGVDMAVTERSNSSFSMLLERVAHRWGPGSGSGSGTPPGRASSASPQHPGVEAAGGSFSWCGLVSRDNSHASMARLAPASIGGLEDMVLEPSAGSLTALLTAAVPCLSTRRPGGSPVLDDNPLHQPGSSDPTALPPQEKLQDPATGGQQAAQQGVAHCPLPGGAVHAAALLHH